jgi:HAD superfamily hydrolase (TIGR01509 family)
MAHMRASIGVLGSFQHVVGSFEIAACKPDPRSYQAVLARAGVQPADAIHIDDRPEMIEGAQRAGLKAIRFESASQLERSLSELGLLDG